MQKIIKVLSIDMDYILEPCIELYNDLVNEKSPRQDLWNFMNSVRQIDEHLKYNDRNLNFIFDAYSKCLKNIRNKNKVIFANSHDAILFELTKKDYYDSTFNIINIDHHHDIFYNPQSAEDVDKKDIVYCGNWVWYLDKYKLVKDYTWISNYNSQKFNHEDVLSCNLKTIIQPNKYILDSNVDVIFVCKSPQWLPQKYDVFFDILKQLHENINKVEAKVIYELYSNGKPKPYIKE
jgi:hypothetical protein